MIFDFKIVLVYMQMEWWSDAAIGGRPLVKGSQSWKWMDVGFTSTKK